MLIRFLAVAGVVALALLGWGQNEPAARPQCALTLVDEEDAPGGPCALVVAKPDKRGFVISGRNGSDEVSTYQLTKDGRLRLVDTAQVRGGPTAAAVFAQR